MLLSPTAFVVSAIFVSFLEDQVRSSNWHGHDIAKFGQGIGEEEEIKEGEKMGKKRDRHGGGATPAGKNGGGGDYPPITRSSRLGWAWRR